MYMCMYYVLLTSPKIVMCCVEMWCDVMWCKHTVNVHSPFILSNSMVSCAGTRTHISLSLNTFPQFLYYTIHTHSWCIRTCMRCGHHNQYQHHHQHHPLFQCTLFCSHLSFSLQSTDSHSVPLSLSFDATCLVHWTFMEALPYFGAHITYTQVLVSVCMYYTLHMQAMQQQRVHRCIFL